MLTNFRRKRNGDKHCKMYNEAEYRIEPKTAVKATKQLFVHIAELQFENNFYMK